MKIAIAGFGVEGESAYRYWAQQGADITIHDQNAEVEIPPGVGSVLGLEAYENLDSYGYDFIVRSPGSRLDIKNITTLITSCTAEFFEKCPVPIIGVTGTKGKGTTASLIHEILTAAGKTSHLVGNIGTPALDELGLIKPGDLVVFELSSFQLMDLHFSPHVAVHLMLEPDHMDWHSNAKEYAQAKANIFKYQSKDDIAVYYAGSKTVQESVKLSKADTKIPYDRNMTSNEGARVADGKILMYDQSVAAVSDVKLLGDHMLDNVCAAVAATWNVLKSSNEEEIRTLYENVLRSFKGLPHRVQFVAKVNGVTYINDSYSANPSAARAGLTAFAEPKVVILGGYDKGAEFNELAKTVKASNVYKAIVVGVTAPKIIKALDEAGFKDYVEGGNTMQQIVDQAHELARPGDVVLLSPGCASFDMFKNFSDRGYQFIAAVRELQK